MYVPQNPLWIFCGFANGSTFRTTFFIDESTMTLTPCGEFGIVVLQSVPLLFYSVINLFLVSAVFPRYDSCWLSRIFSSRILICLVTIFILISSIILSFLFPFPLKDVTLIEYAIISIIWAVFCILWILSKYWKSWTYSQGLTISLFFASKAFYLITVNRWILYGFYDPRTYTLFTVSVLHLINVIGNTIEWKLHRSIINRDILCDYINLNEHADEGAGWWSRVFFCWTNQLVKKGGRKQLNSLDDVFCLPPSLQVAAIEKKLVENSPTYFSDGQPYSIARSLLSTFGPSFFSLALLRIASDGFTFAGPVLLHLLVSTLENPSPQPEAFTYASIMILCSFLAAIFSTNFTYYVQKIGLRVRAATVTAIYDKLLRVPLSEMQSFSSGKILNLISTDVDRIVNFCNSFHAFWSLPVQLLIALYLLYREVGMAFISGLLAALFLIPINKYVTNCIGKMSEKLMHCKDQRIKVVRETMEAIRTVKASAWESFFETRIGELRDKELYYLKARKYLDAVCVYLWASAPLLITISILTTYTMVFHEKLTAAKVFTSLALVNILIMPLNAFPWVLNGLVEAVVSIRRLEWFFALNNIDLYDIYSLTDEKNTLLSVKEGHFFWKVQPTVKGVTFTGRKGTIVGITGDVGSGKSSLLLGLLGETASISECIGITQESVNKGIGYVGQERWLSRGSIRDNILCGKGFDTRLYDMVLRATCLQRDINLMPGGDQYEISDNGATLSGGQRTRVALARALYQDNSVYLLDEPFASLDRKVADTIWKEGIEHLKERGKLIIVATHDVRLLARADQLIVLGKDVMQTGIPSDFLNVTADELRTDDYGETGDLEEMEQIVRQDEEKQVGAVRISVCATYVRVTGIFLSVMIIGALLAMQSSKNLADWWLSRWTENQGNYSTAETWHEMLFAQRKTELLDSHEMDRSMFFLLIYASIAVLNTMFTLIRAFLFAYGGIQAARNLHSSLLTRLLQAPVSWWDRTPSGRVINRICADVYTCDDSLPFQLNIVLASLFNLIGALIITIIGLPLLAPVIALLFIIYFLIQKYYRLTTVELKRLTSLSLSPFYSHLSDTVNGLVTIRAQRFVERFTRELRLCLTVNLRAQFSSLAASQWLSVRLSLIAVSVVAAIAICSIVQHHITGVDSGLVGLAITYALSMTGLLNGLLGSFIETEKEMVSVERIDEYLNYVPKEENPGNGELPEVIKGYVEFKDVSLRYDSYLPLALDNVCLRVKAGQRVAVIGRTGSGKTSLFQAVLRTTPIETGQITIDDIDIATISLSSLRSTVGFISQQPLIFSGTLYENLTLNCSNVDRNQVSNVARVAHLDSLLSRIGGLDGRIEEGGKNLSFGERQVISICRILLAKSKLVLVDEATSHLDAEAHYRMMSLLSVHLPNSTVISSVHILSGLSEYDVVVEMERGRIVRYGPPSESFVE